MKQRILGLWRQVLPRIKVGGVWKDVDTGWIKVNGVFKKFKYPFVAKGIYTVLQRWTYTTPAGQAVERRSCVHNGSAFVFGNISQLSFTIDGVVAQFRGIETGADVVNGIGSWKWLSLQFHGNVDSNKLARVLYFEGRTAIFKVGAYDAVNNMSFFTYELDTPYTFAINVGQLTYF